MARPSGGPWRFWVLGSAGSSISRGRSAPRQPATLPNRIASLQEAIGGEEEAVALLLLCHRLHRRDEGVNHFSAGHFLTHHSPA
jgi:hypothetical protein